MNPVHFDSRLPAFDVSCTFSRRQVVLGGVAATLVAPLGGCGGAALFAPFFTFTFGGVVDRQIVSVAFFPDANSVNQPSGRFDSSNIFVSGFQNPFKFSGTFDGRDLQFAVVGATAPLGDTYRGHFIEDDTIVLTPSNVKFKPITVRLDDQTIVDNRFVKRFVPTLTGDWTGKDANGADWALRLDTNPLDNDAGNATVLLVGTETLGPAAGTALLGYASVHYIELDIGPLHLTGTLQAGPTPPKAGDPQVTATINFKGGGSLQRKV